MTQFSVQSNANGDVAIVAVFGRVDSETAPNLDAELIKVANESNKIVLDLKDVTFLSSAGLRVIVKALQTAQKSGGEVKLACAPESVETILRTVGMLEMLKIYPAVYDAVNSF